MSRTVDRTQSTEMRGAGNGSSKRSFAPEFREDAVTTVLDSSWPIAQIARELNIGEGTLENWVNTYRRAHEDEPTFDVTDRARFCEVERRLREVKMENEFLKKGRLVLRPGSPASEKHEFIDTTLTDADCVYPIHLMCVWLEVSRSGFYDWRSRPESATARRWAELTLLIAHEFDDSDQTYGYRRVHAALNRHGVQVGVELVRHLMRDLGPYPCLPRPRRLFLHRPQDRARPPHGVPDPRSRHTRHCQLH